MEDKIKETLEKVILLAQQNREFGEELRKRLQITSSATSVSVDDVNLKSDVQQIREALEIRADKSLSYNFIVPSRLKDQLIIDNLRMENAALNVTIDETERFYLFCANAFYQVENIINYYFYVLYPDTNELLTCIEQMTSCEKENYRFKRTGNEKNVGDIAISNKLNAICNILFPNDKIKITFSQLKQVRNEGVHRCMIIVHNKDMDNSLYKFFRYNTFNSIRIALIRLVNAIKDDFAIRNTSREVVAEITTLLPSACYVKFNNSTVELPLCFFSFVKNKNVGEKINLFIVNNKIINVGNP